MKIFFGIILNVILVILLFLSGEYYFGHKYCRLNFNNLEAYKKAVLHPVSAEKYFFDLYNNDKNAYYAFTPNFRKDENPKSKKKPIIITGCSFAWGDGLNDDETISYKLGKLTGRPIYNRAGKGFGPSHFLYQLKSEWFYQKHEEPEYVIYIIIANHMGRINKFKIEPLCVEFQPRYKYKKDKLYEVLPKITDRSVMVETYQYNRDSYDNSNQILKEYFVEALAAVKKHWKNTKLVVLMYPTYFGPGDKLVLDSLRNELSDTEIITIDIESLVGHDLNKKEYTVADGYHPSARAWDVILPPLIKELELK